MKNNPFLLQHARNGYAGDVDNASYFSSDVWLAHVAGAQLAHAGLAPPAKCAKSRGYSVQLELTNKSAFLVQFTRHYLQPHAPKRLY